MQARDTELIQCKPKLTARFIINCCINADWHRASNSLPAIGLLEPSLIIPSWINPPLFGALLRFELEFSPNQLAGTTLPLSKAWCKIGKPIEFAAPGISGEHLDSRDIAEKFKEQEFWVVLGAWSSTTESPDLSVSVPENCWLLFL